MLEKIISSKARVAILRLFYLNEERKYHIREVSRLLGINLNQVRKELIRLSDAGLLKKERIGNAHLYGIDKDFMFHDELASIVKKSTGFEKPIEKELDMISEIEFAFIFGSYAEGKFTAKSDIDIMIIGTPDLGELNMAINRAERKTGRSIQYTVYPMDEFEEKKKYGFVKNVMMKKKIFLIGDLDELK